MKKLYISTNLTPAGLHSCFENKHEEDLIEKFESKFSNVVLDSDNPLYEIDSTDTILIFDGCTKANFNLTINRSTDYLLYHSTTDETIKKLFDKVKESEHNGSNEDHYRKFLLNLLEEKPKSTDELINQIFEIVEGKTPDNVTGIKQISFDSAKQSFQNLYRNIDLLNVMIENNEEKDNQNKIIDDIKKNSKNVSDYLYLYSNKFNKKLEISEINPYELQHEFNLIRERLESFFLISTNPS